MLQLSRILNYLQRGRNACIQGLSGSKQALLAFDLFGDAFLWWYVVCYEKQLLNSNWSSVEKIKIIYNFLKENSVKEEFDKLQKKYQEELERSTQEYGNFIRAGIIF